MFIVELPVGTTIPIHIIFIAICKHKIIFSCIASRKENTI